MKLTGLGLNAALQLAGALAGALLILYLLRLRRRRITVPFAPLWSRVLVDKEATNWLQRLKRLLSLLLWVVIMALIVAALTDPQPEQELERGRNIVVVLDTSASMSALEGGGTRFNQARKEVDGLIKEMGPHDKMMILAVDGQVRSLNGEFSDNAGALKEVLNEVQPSATQARIIEGLRTAVDSLAERKSPEIYLVSDGAFGDGFRLPEGLIKDNLSFEHIQVGEAQGNVAITGFNIRRYLSNKLDYEVYVQVQNFFNEVVYAELTVYNLVRDENQEGGFFYKIIERRTLELGPGSSELRFYRNLALGSDHLAAKIELKSDGLVDALEMDNEAFVLVPKFQQVSVLAVTPGNLFLEAALLLNENFLVEVMSPDDPFLHPGGSEEIRLTNLRKQHYDVVIFDNSFWEEGQPAIAPEPEVAGNYLYLNPKGEASPFRVKEIVEPLVERIDRKHPLSRWLALKDLNILRGSRISKQPKDKVIVRAIEGPLVVARRAKDYNAIALGFSIVESDIVFRVALPVFLINSVDWFMDETNSLIRAYRTGENWHIPVPVGLEKVNLRDPLGKAEVGLPTFDDKVVYYGAHTGFYELMPNEDVVAPAGIPERWEIAANFSSPAESMIAPAKEPLPKQEAVQVPEQETQALDPRVQKWAWLLEITTYDLWYYFVFGVLIFLVLEWFTYHRRWTV